MCPFDLVRNAPKNFFFFCSFKVVRTKWNRRTYSITEQLLGDCNWSPKVKTWTEWKPITERRDVLSFWAYKPANQSSRQGLLFRLQMSVFPDSSGDRNANIGLIVMLIHYLFKFFSILVGRGYDTGARVPREDKMPLLKHAGISTWHSLTAVTMANICKWRRAPLSLWPCHGGADTSLWTPSMLGKGGDKQLNSGRRTGVTASLVLSLYSLCSAAIPVVFAYRSSFRWPICLVESFALLFFCLCSALEGGTGLHGRDSLKWKSRLLPAVAKAHLIRG